METPISLGRAGYWLGRAYSATGDRASAKLAYSFAAQHQSSFYGLLAAEKAGSRFDKTLVGRKQFPNWVTASFTKSSVFKAGLLLLTAEQPDLAERFLTHMSESLNPDELGQLGTLLAELRDPHLQVMVGKRAAQYGHIIAAPYYALHPLINTSHPVAAELMLAIARRESEFNPTLVSGAGARGLMQILPGTAKETAKEIKIKYNVKRLLTDWKYNATIGGAYLAKLSRRFDGNPVLVSAAYNAGPNRVDSWIKKLGDPRAPEADIVEWIEMIPYVETRNYVMRVAESLTNYRARLGKPAAPQPFSAQLKRPMAQSLAPKGE
ncbi:MAG: lytic transglycosylase domain-containing protein [Marinovum sp.]|nr:lytic transglycosylase domain-containing protein [Marinovum sp.]